MKIYCPDYDLTNPASAAPIVTDVDGTEVPVKNWYEKSKDKWHFVFGPNKANRKYVSHNEFLKNAVDGTYEVADRTTAPRTIGSSQPDRLLVPYMTEEDKADYDAIIARAIENRNAQRADAKAHKNDANKAAKLEARIKKLQEQLAAALAAENEQEEN